MGLLITITKGIGVHFILSMMGILLGSIRYITKNRGCEFNRTVISPFFCKLILKGLGMKVKLYDFDKLPNEQVLFFYNHNSYMDGFVIPTLPIKNFRYMITEGGLGMKVVQWCNYGNQALLLPSKNQRERRIQRFKDFVIKLKHENYSVFAAPEGQHEFKHQISWFNRGIFHLATETKLKIVPIFIGIPAENNPFEGYRFKPGTISVELLEPIETTDWRIEDIDKNKEMVRKVFVNHFEKRFGVKSPV